MRTGVGLRTAATGSLAAQYVIYTFCHYLHFCSVDGALSAGASLCLPVTFLNSDLIDSVKLPWLLGALVDGTSSSS